MPSNVLASHRVVVVVLLLMTARQMGPGFSVCQRNPGFRWDIASLQQTLKRVYPHVLSFGYQYGGSLLSSNICLASVEPINLSSNARLLDASTANNVKHFLANELGNLVTDVIYSDDYNPVSHQRRYVQLLWRKEMLRFFKDEQLTWLMY